MNEVLKALKTRRSIRAYKSEQITDAELEQVLEAGKYAASANGRQGTILVAVQSPEMIKKLSKMNAEVMGKNIDPYYGAPTIVLVFADSDFGPYVEDGSCVIQNMMVAAHSLGLGSCWIHREKEMFRTEEGKALKREWGVPDSYEGVGSCILGYPACELPDPAARKDGFVVYVK